MPKYRKKQVVIEAMQWTGDNTKEIKAFCPDASMALEYYNPGKLYVYAVEGGHYASYNDFIIKGAKGEFYPCKPDIFGETYEKVEE